MTSGLFGAEPPWHTHPSPWAAVTNSCRIPHSAVVCRPWQHPRSCSSCLASACSDWSRPCT